MSCTCMVAVAVEQQAEQLPAPGPEGWIATGVTPGGLPGWTVDWELSLCCQRTGRAEG